MTEHHLARVRPGDVLEVKGLPGEPSRRGVVLELLGAPGHEHFRVRWDEEHESLFFPVDGEGVHVHPRARRSANYGRRRGRAPDAAAGAST
ncbi:MAG TPA: DUF1918 domain-containing protein [Baekduia sp.]|nr:DUF1918 domain-containing protein [Baekduia sp.]